MRVPKILCLLLVLTACATRPSNTPEQHVATPTPVQATATVLPPPTQANLPPPFAKLAPTTSVLLQLDAAFHAINLNSGADTAWGVSFGATARSSDGSKIVAIEAHGQSCESFAGGSACRPGAGTLHIIDTRTWHEMTNALPPDGWIGNIAFNSDATRVAFTFNQPNSSMIMLADSNTAQFVVQRAIDFRPSFLNFANDGKTLGVYGQATSDRPGVSKPPPPQVLSIDAATLQVKWEQQLTNVVSGIWCVENCSASQEQVMSENWYPAVVASRDGSGLYIVHADEEKLTAVDLAAHTIRTNDIREARGGIEDLLAQLADVAEAKGGDNGALVQAVLSLDGTRLLTIRQTMSATLDVKNNFWDSIYALGDLQVIDVANGHILATRSMTNRGGMNVYLNGFALTADGSRVSIVQSDPSNEWWTDVFDPQNLKPVAHLDNWRVVSARRLDGLPVLVAHQPNTKPFQLAVIDPYTFTVIRTLSLENVEGWINP